MATRKTPKKKPARAARPTTRAGRKTAASKRVQAALDREFVPSRGIETLLNKAAEPAPAEAQAAIRHADGSTSGDVHIYGASAFDRESHVTDAANYARGANANIAQGFYHATGPVNGVAGSAARPRHVAPKAAPPSDWLDETRKELTGLHAVLDALEASLSLVLAHDTALVSGPANMVAVRADSPLSDAIANIKALTSLAVDRVRVLRGAIHL
jgi:hypothetical protein